MPGAGQRHIGQPSLVGVQPTAVFVALGQIPGIRIRVLHAVAAVAQRTEYLVIDLHHVVQSRQRVHRVLPRRAVVREAGKDVRVDPYRGRHAGGVGQPGPTVLLPVFGSRPHAVDQPSGMGFVQGNRQSVLAVVRHDARCAVDDGHGVPFQALGLVDGHQFYVGLVVMHGGRLILDIAQHVRPGEETAQRRRPTIPQFLDIGVGQVDQRVQRHPGHGGVRGLFAVSYGLGNHRIDVEIQRTDRGANHLGQRMPQHRLHVAQHGAGTQHPGLGAVAECAVTIKQLPQIAPLQQIAEEHGIAHLVAVLPHHRFPLLRRAVGIRHAGLRQRPESHPRILPVGKRGQTGQVAR